MKAALACVAILLIPGVIAADASPRQPDLLATDLLTMAMAGDDGAILFGSDDPGTRFSGGDPMGLGPLPDATVWFLHDAAGKAELSGDGDYVAGTTDCESRVGDNCNAPIVAVDLTPDGNIMAIASALANSPADSALGLVQLIDRDAGLLARYYLSQTPAFIHINEDGTAITVAGRIGSAVGSAQGVAVMLAYDGNTLVKVQELDLGAAPVDLAMARSGDRGIVAAGTAQRIFDSEGSSYPYSGPSGDATAVDLASDPMGHAVSGHASGDVALTTQETNAALLVKRPGKAISAVAMTAMASHYVAGDASGVIHLYEITPGEASAAQLRSSIDLGDGPVTDLAWSGDGVLLVAALGDRVHLLQRTSAGFAQLWSNKLPANVLQVDISTNGDAVAGAWAGGVRVFEASLALSGNAPSVVVQPRGEADGVITYQNLGNRPTKVDLRLDAPFGWNVTLETTSFSLGVDASRKVAVHLVAPDDGLPANAVVRIEHTLEDGLKGITSMPVEIPAIHKVRLVPIGAQSASIQGGGVARFTLMIRNDGNVAEEVPLQAVVTPGWAVGLSQSNVRLDPETTTNVSVDLSAPASAGEGATGEVTVASSKAAEPALFAAAVGARFGVKLVAPGTVPIVAGNQTEFNIQITNTGNILDSYRLEMLVNIPEGWAIGLHGSLLVVDVRDMGPGDAVLVPVHVRPPASLPANGFLQMSFKATSLGDQDRVADARTSLSVAGTGTDPKSSPGLPLLLLVAALVLAVRNGRRRP